LEQPLLVIAITDFNACRGKILIAVVKTEILEKTLGLSLYFAVYPDIDVAYSHWIPPFSKHRIVRILNTPAASSLGPSSFVSFAMSADGFLCFGVDQW
jgi:hypothetical protein